MNLVVSVYWRFVLVPKNLVIAFKKTHNITVTNTGFFNCV